MIIAMDRSNLDLLLVSGILMVEKIFVWCAKIKQTTFLLNGKIIMLMCVYLDLVPQDIIQISFGL